MDIYTNLYEFEGFTMNKRFALFLVGLWAFSNLTAQETLEERERLLKSQYGWVKLENLIGLSKSYEEKNPKKRQRFARQAEQMINNILKEQSTFDKQEMQLILSGMHVSGKARYEKENYIEARKLFKESRRKAVDAGAEEMVREASLYLFKLDSLESKGVFKDNIFSRAFKDLNINAAINNSANNVTIGMELNLAKVSEKKGDTTEAIVHYEKVAKLFRNAGAFDKAEQVEDKIKTFESIRRVQLALNQMETHQVVAEEVVAETDSFSGLTMEHRRPMLKAPEIAKFESLKDIAENLESSEDYEDALKYYKEYMALQQKFASDSLIQAQLRARAAVEMERLRGQNEIADLNIAAIENEKDVEERIKNILFVIVGLVLIATFFILLMYVLKRKKHHELTQAYDHLHATKRELEEAEQRISKLLEQQVSPEIATALIEDRPQMKQQQVAVLFVDIREFTPKAEKMEPQELIDYQNKVFGFMIEVVNEHGGNINQFMGDGFMATFGAPVSHGNDARNAYLSAIQILKEIGVRNQSQQIPETRIGIGIHFGNVVTGNVGTEHRKQFSVTGNTVIIAARVEQLNKEFGSQLIITKEVRRQLRVEDINEKEIKELSVNIKGRKEAIQIFVLMESATEESTTIDDRMK